jgi:hypothetical protein
MTLHPVFGRFVIVYGTLTARRDVYVYFATNASSRSDFRVTEAFCHADGTPVHNRPLVEKLPKLRYHQCRQAPEAIELADDPTRNASGNARNSDA